MVEAVECGEQVRLLASRDAFGFVCADEIHTRNLDRQGYILESTLDLLWIFMRNGR